MNACPFHQGKVRPELPPLTQRIAKLPVDERGYPVPFFVQWLDENNESSPAGVGRPEFRMMDPLKWSLCYKQKLCWVCGEPLGVHMAFVLGPMCCVNRVTSEPPSHGECAHWSVKGCPFLSRPKMVRREDELTEENKCNVAGVSIERNPGVMAIWTTRTYKAFRVPAMHNPVGPSGNAGVLINVGEPENVEWWTEGRLATRAEVLAAIDAGCPALDKVCVTPDGRRDEAAAADLKQKVEFVRTRYLPKE
jgi:hypothetical protein